MPPHFRRVSVYVPFLLASLGAFSFAQVVPAPTMLSVWGGKAGTTVEVTISGSNLNQASAALLEAGIAAEITSAGPGSIVSKVTIPPATPAGLYEVRVVTPGGSSTPGSFYFHVSDFASFNETQNNNSLEQHDYLPELPVTINGIVNGGEDRDFFHLQARKGEVLVCEAFAQRLCRPPGISPLNLELALYDSSGARTWRGIEREPGNTDPLLQCKIPADGHYLLEVRDEFYRGAPVYHYRVNVGMQPVLNLAMPAALSRGTTTEVILQGVNLAAVQSVQVGPAIYLPPIANAAPFSAAGVSGQIVKTSSESLTIKFVVPPDASPGARDVRVNGGSGSSNAVKLLVLDGAVTPSPALPLQGEGAGGRGDAKSALRLTPPFIHTERLSSKRQSAYYVFQARQGERWIIEAYGRRLLSGADLFLTLYDSNGKELSAVDDTVGPDPRIDFNVTQPGQNDYTLRVHDMAAVPDATFVVAARRFQPDFALTVAPDNPNLTIGTNGATIALSVTRIDGYAGPIQLVAEGLPKGVSFTPTQVNQGQANVVNLQFKADTGSELGMVKVVLRGKATIGGQEVVRDAAPLSPYQFGGGITLNRASSGFYVTVVEPFSFSLEAGSDEVVAKPGASSTVQLKVIRAGNFPGNIALRYSGLPTGFTVTPVATGENATNLNLTIAVPANATVGNHTLTITGTASINNQTVEENVLVNVMVQ